MECDAAKNYMLLEIYNWYKRLDCNMEVAKNFKSLHITPATHNIMGLKILKRKCACGSIYLVKIIWKPLS